MIRTARCFYVICSFWWVWSATVYQKCHFPLLPKVPNDNLVMVLNAFICRLKCGSLENISCRQVQLTVFPFPQNDRSYHVICIFLFQGESSLSSHFVLRSAPAFCCGPIDIWLPMLLPMKYTDGMMHCLLNEHPQKSFHAMAEHSSQWVWYACCHKLLKWNWEDRDHVVTLPYSPICFPFVFMLCLWNR